MSATLTPFISSTLSIKEDEEHNKTEQAQSLERIESAGYPNTFRLTMIVIALCLVIFLSALDQVRKKYFVKQ
jgi:hypothetical protein